MALEEVDHIIFRTLAEIGCDTEAAGSLSELTPEQVYEAAAGCVRHIRPELADSVASRMPVSLTARLKMCTAMADCCKDLGFRGDLGYHTFLYGSTKEIRNVIVFLIDKFPKQDFVPLESDADARTALLRGMRTVLSRALEQPWTPHYCRDTQQRTQFLTESLSTSTNTFVNLQPSDSGAVVPSVLHWTAQLRAGVTVTLPAPVSVGAAAPAPAPAPCQPPPMAAPAEPESSKLSASTSDSGAHNQSAAEQKEQEQEQKEREQELAAATAQLEQAQRRLAKGTERYKRLLAQCVELQTVSTPVSATVSSRRAALSVRRRARAALAAGGDSGGGALAVQRASQRATSRRAEWAERRGALQQQLEALRRTSRAAPLQQLARRRDQLQRELSHRERALVTLRQQTATVTKHVKRAAYTKRILEILGSVKKQRQGISATIEETRQLRKQINITSDKIARTFQMAEELIFRDAASDEWSRASYRGLTALHDSCSELVCLVDQTAAIMRQARRVQETIDVERSNHVEQNLEQVRGDLAKVRLENQQLRSAELQVPT